MTPWVLLLPAAVFGVVAAFGLGWDHRGREESWDREDALLRSAGELGVRDAQRYDA